jgi:peptidoglycan/LPS O-acetylase OafA/YrhL
MPESDLSLPPVVPPGAVRREPALDGVRGAAMLAVMLFHFTMFEQSGQPVYRAALSFASLGWVGLDLFFVLSGFLITGILLDTKGHRHFFRNFYLRRALRMFPLYYAVLAIVMLALLATLGVRTPESRELLGRQVWLWTYTTNIEFAVAGHWNFNIGQLWLNHFWSLAVEEQFYLVWPAIVLVLSRRALAVTTVALVVAAPLLRAAMIAYGARPGVVLTLTPCRVDALALGALAAMLVRDAAMRSRVLPTLPFVSLVALPPLVWLAATRRLYWLDPTVVVLALTPLAVLSCVVVLRCALAPEGRLARLLRSSMLQFLGKYSYATFVVHYMLWPLLEQHLPAGRITAATGSELLGLGAHVIVGSAISVAAGFVSYHVLERHFLALKRNFPYSTVLVSEPACPTEVDAVLPGADRSTVVATTSGRAPVGA